MLVEIDTVVYSVFHFGKPGDSASFVIDIPYPFITPSDYDNSIQAYDWLDLQEDKSGEAAHVYGTPFYSNSFTMSLNNYGEQVCGATVQKQVDLVIPETGFVHLVVHVVLGMEMEDVPDDCDLVFSVSGAENSSSDARAVGWETVADRRALWVGKL